MSKEEFQQKIKRKLALAEIGKVNPDSELSLDNYGFLRMTVPDTSKPFSLPDDWTCEEGCKCSPNTITLRHIYKADGEFVITMMAYA